MTSTIDNGPALNNRGIDQDKAVTTATVTGSLLQKPVILAAANLGSCDKNPDKADTILDTGTIVGNEGGNKESLVDPRGDGAKTGRGADKAGRRKFFETFEKCEKMKNLKSAARQREFISEKNRHAPNPPDRLMEIKADVKVQKEYVTRITVGPLKYNN
jgi:hypothetical protein